MQFNPVVEEAIAQAAWRYGADVDALRAAIIAESATDLSAVLRIDRAAAESRMAAIRRALVVQDDLGAGCRRLTDEVQHELLAAIARL